MVNRKTANNNEVIIKLEHLSPRIQELITNPIRSVNEMRKVRTQFEGVSLMSLSIIIASDGLLTPFLIGPAMIRTAFAEGIQIQHNEIVNEMSKGVFQSDYEKRYPEGWINPNKVANTHPIFYVDWRGNIHFLKNSRWEYAKYVFQNKFRGKIGLNPWMWRAYLKPPEATEKIRTWALSKAKEWIRKKRAPIPKLKPAPVRVQRQGFRPALRRAK